MVVSERAADRVRLPGSRAIEVIPQFEAGLWARANVNQLSTQSESRCSCDLAVDTLELQRFAERSGVLIRKGALDHHAAVPSQRRERLLRRRALETMMNKADAPGCG